MNDPSPPTRTAHPERVGYLLGIGAYGYWGFLPIYFKMVKSVEPIAIVAQRVVWSLLVLGLLVGAVRGWPAVRKALTDRRARNLLALSALLIAVNWLFYVYAVNSGHVLAGSLGYYLNPLANILLGRLFLKERVSRLQWIAVAIAAAGIAVLAAGALGQLWISLILCASFSSYGLVRKIVAADALTGLAIETGFLLPAALAYLFLTDVPGSSLLAPTPHVSLLLGLSGIISTVPLLLFAGAARRLPYSTLGMLQFLAPTLQFLLAVFLYGEPFTRAHAIAFAAIWTALALYAAALFTTARRERLSKEGEAVMLGEC